MRPMNHPDDRYKPWSAERRAKFKATIAARKRAKTVTAMMESRLAEMAPLLNSGFLFVEDGRGGVVSIMDYVATGSATCD